MKNNYKKSDNTYILRLDKGQEIVQELKNFCKEQNIKGGSISAIGFADNIELGCFDLEKGDYCKKIFKDGREITSLLGSVSTIDNDLKIHLHGTFSTHDFSIIGGHLFSATVALTCEIFIIQTSEIKRKNKDNLTVFDFS